MNPITMSFTRCALFLLVGLLAACTSDVEPLTPAQRQVVDAYGSKVSPSPQHRLDLDEDARRDDDAVPRLDVMQTRRPPRLDGSLGDPVWKFANTSRAFVETRKGGVAPIQASAKVLWDARYLYVGVDVHDALLRASHTEPDDHLWEQDCVELMIDPDGDGKNYFEIQVSPRGVVFDTRYDSRRVPKPFGHTDWDSRIRVGVSPRGKLDDDQADAGYGVEIAIPWQAFSLAGKPAAPPAIGDEWRANLYVMDLGADRQQAAAWSALGIGDFHVPRRFGILAFEGPAEPH